MKSMIFSAPMVRAILEGRKTQTRLIMKPQPEKWVDCFKPSMNPSTWISSGPFIQDKSGFLTGKPLEIRSNGGSVRCPFKIGDRLWVRETWWNAASRPSFRTPDGEAESYYSRLVHYAADGDPENTPNRHHPNGLFNGAIAAPDPWASWHKRPSIHMPRWASRITLEITGIKAQRVQEITKDDVIAEGMQIPVRESETPDKVVPYLRITGKCEPPYKWPQKPVESDYYRHEFAFCWDEINGPGSWDANPFVWAYTFKKIEKGGGA